MKPSARHPARPLAAVRPAVRARAARPGLVRPVVCVLALAAVPAGFQAAAQPATPPPASPGADAWQPRGTAELAALDKVRAQATTLQARVGQPLRYGSLTITVRGCVVRPPDQAPDSAAFVEVADSHPGGPGFRGWMIASAPALGMMEHPLYDVRVVACR